MTFAASYPGSTFARFMTLRISSAPPMNSITATEIAARRRRGERLQQTNAAVRERDSGDAAGQGDQHAFGERLPDQASAPGAEREPDRDLALPRGRPREEQVRDVDACDQQDE